LLTGEQEANLSLLGVQSIFKDRHNRSLIIDIGGGSTELILSSNQSIDCMESIPLGVVHLSEKYLLHDPPLEEEIRHLRQDVPSLLKSKSKIVNSLETSNSNNIRLIGTAGTVTTLAAMDLKLPEYDIDKVNKHILSYNYLIKLFNYMVAINSNERIELPGLEQGREIVIIPGTAIVLIIMELLIAQELCVSDAGLLEGILLEKAGLYT
jgi:exopolyphosphatase/guanosine-5'-triphosphate,3'-diphosphate pyrophosphatase